MELCLQPGSRLTARLLLDVLDGLPGGDLPADAATDPRRGALCARAAALMTGPGLRPPEEDPAAFGAALSGRLERLGVGRVSLCSLPLARDLPPGELAALAGLAEGLPVRLTEGPGTELLVLAFLRALDAVPAGETPGWLRACSHAAGPGPGEELCALLLEEEEEEAGWPGEADSVLQLETHVDHLTGEEIGACLTALSASRQVLDLLWIPGMGKKNRPMGLLRLLCRPEDGPSVCRALFRHTHSLGCRVQRLARRVLPRREGRGLLSDGQSARAKEYRLEGQWYVRPESDEVCRAAEEAGLGAPALRVGRLPEGKG